MPMSIKALYVHVPFCAHICAYCDFMRVGYHPHLVEQYLDALAKEINQYDLKEVDTLYFGGGTPSVLSIEELKRLFELLKPVLKRAGEITFEMNPESCTLEKVQLLKAVGINRVSLGVQSFNAFELQEMDRQHDSDDITRSIQLLRNEGIDNISIDLMYGIPFQTLDSLTKSLDKLFSYRLPHFSIYSLTIEPNSKWGREKRKPIDADDEANMYEWIVKRALEVGYRHYEVASFTLNKPSAHNLHYWHYDDYLGIGPAAASKIGYERLDNTRDMQAYFKDPLAKECAILSFEDEAFERLMMGLRLDEGINIEEFNKTTGFDLLKHYQSAIEKHVECGNIILNASHLMTSEKGREVLHEVLVDFMLD